MRLAKAADAAGIHAIFRPIVEKTAISFTTACPSPAEFAAKIDETVAALPWLVEEDGSRIVGYAYAGKHRALGAYRWAVETSIYVAANAHRRGIARRLYACLFEILRKQGYYNAYAGITLPNDPSIALHESLGFRRFCVFESIGHKLGQWRSVAWYLLPLQTRYDETPADPIPLPRLLSDDADLRSRLAPAPSGPAQRA